MNHLPRRWPRVILLSLLVAIGLSFAVSHGAWLIVQLAGQEQLIGSGVDSSSVEAGGVLVNKSQISYGVPFESFYFMESHYYRSERIDPRSGSYYVKDRITRSQGWEMSLPAASAQVVMGYGVDFKLLLINVLAVFVAIVISYYTAGYFVWRRRMYRNLCFNCGYSMSACPNGICPECGAAS